MEILESSISTALFHLACGGSVSSSATELGTITLEVEDDMQNLRFNLPKGYLYPNAVSIFSIC